MNAYACIFVLTVALLENISVFFVLVLGPLFIPKIKAQAAGKILLYGELSLHLHVSYISYIGMARNNCLPIV